MPTTSDYLTQLEQDREDLVDNLETKGITGLTGDETFTELVPEVLNIPSGGADDYFRNTITVAPTSTVNGISRLVKKVPKVYLGQDVTSLQYCFRGCSAIEFDFSVIDTSKVTNMRNMFDTCTLIVNLDLSNFDTSRVTRMDNMFASCVNLQHLDIRNFDFTNVSNYTGMFENVPNDCEIIVKDNTAKTWIISKFSNLTNVKTVEEL